MITALRYRFVQCEKQHPSLIPKWKGKEIVRKHKHYSDDEIAAIRKACVDGDGGHTNKEMQLYVELSLETAPRIQDLAELTWEDIKEIEDEEHKGYAIVHFKKQKTTERNPVITKDTFELLKEFKEE